MAADVRVRSRREAVGRVPGGEKVGALRGEGRTERPEDGQKKWERGNREGKEGSGTKGGWGWGKTTSVGVTMGGTGVGGRRWGKGGEQRRRKKEKGGGKKKRGQ